MRTLKQSIPIISKELLTEEELMPARSPANQFSPIYPSRNPGRNDPNKVSGVAFGGGSMSGGSGT